MDDKVSCKDIGNDTGVNNASSHNRSYSFKASILAFIASFLNVSVKERSSILVTLLKTSISNQPWMTSVSLTQD